MRTLRSMALLVFCSASSAQAWEVFLQISSELSVRGSTETSAAAARASQPGKPGSVCSTDADCEGYCDFGTCADPVLAQPSAPEPRALECLNDESCAIGFACQDRRCVDQTSPPPLPTSVLVPCESDAQCTPLQHCVNKQCLSSPPPPSSSLQRRGSELYLRERAVQLRQDLALGEGPVIAMLASELRVSAPKLGRIMRVHRAELAALVGDASETNWPTLFLRRLDALCMPSVRISSR